MEKKQFYLGWVLRLIAAIILLQTLYFKFTAHPESVILFTKLGVEPWGRIATGVIELITAVMLLWRPTVFFGAIMGIGLMSGAIASHLFVIGVESQGDGGQLFILAFVVWFACVFIAFLFRNDILKMGFLPAFIKNKIAG
jgi:hypothetical protein